MAGDVSKHLERAKRFLEKNRVEDAIEAYLAVLDEAPQHQEATQALGDLYARMDQPERAAVYYGMLFDLLVDPKDETKALAIYNRFLRSNSGVLLPERIARYAWRLRSAVWHSFTRRPTCNPATRFARRPCWSPSREPRATRCFSIPMATRSCAREIWSVPGRCWTALSWRKRKE